MRRLSLTLPLAMLVVCLATSGTAQAQQSWEYSPYLIRVWLATDSTGGLNDQILEQVRQTLLQRAEAVMGACWTLEVESPPEAIQADVAFDVELVSPEEVETLAPDLLQKADKIVLLSIGANPREFVIRVREMDCRTRYFGAVVERRVRQPDCIAAEAFSALITAFSPMVRIEAGEEKRLVTRLRAGGLILDKESPAYIKKDDVLMPIVRKNDRLGKATRIDVVEWTFLQVVDRYKTNPNILNCYVHSAMRSPIRGRGGSRREQYAFKIRPTHESTLLLINAQVRRNETPYSLPGLEVYSKRPSTDPRPATPEERLAAAKANPAELLGHTDWRGSIKIERYNLPLRVVYLKNGGQLLRRLPIVPGLHESLEAVVPDDDPRLQAEGYIKGFHGQIMDLVAQRQILAARIRKRIRDGKLEDAKTLIAEFRALPTRNDLARRLDAAQNRQKQSPNKYVQGRIDTLYGDTRTMLGKYLDPDLANKLMGEISGASSGAAGTSE